MHVIRGSFEDLNDYCILHIFITLVSKGNSAHLMKPGAKRRRSKEEIKAAKKKEKDDAKEMADALIELAELRAKDEKHKKEM